MSAPEGICPSGALSFTTNRSVPAHYAKQSDTIDALCASWLVEILAVAGDDLLVPEEAVLAVAIHLLEVELVAVDVDEAIALGDALVCGDQVEALQGL